MAQDFVEAMKSGGIMSLFLLAGEKMLKATTEWKELEQAYEAHEKNPCPNNTLKVEELEDEFEGTHEYETFGNETLQAAKLQSMDYCNKVTDKLYVYDQRRKERRREDVLNLHACPLLEEGWQLEVLLPGRLGSSGRHLPWGVRGDENEV